MFGLLNRRLAKIDIEVFQKMVMLIHEMPKKKQDKSLTKDELGGVLHKYINPLYEKVDKLEFRMNNLELKMNKLELNQSQLKDDVDEVKKIQLRMESRLVDDNKLLHDRDDAHDKKLKDHDERISSLEGRS